MLKRWEMQLSRALFLSSERTMCHGACLLSVASSVRSRAREYSFQPRNDSRSIGLSFHCRSGSLILASNRLCCSFFPTSSQYLTRIIPASTMYFSAVGQSFKKVLYCSLEQKPITCSTPARLYQLRSQITISPAVGNCAIYLCMYI